MLRASSTKSLNKAISVFDAQPDPAYGDESEACYGLCDLFKTESSLRRSITDPARSSEDKEALVKELFEGKFPAATVAVMRALASGKWSNDADLIVALEKVGTHILLMGALKAEELDLVEEELFEVYELLGKNPQLRNALADTRGADPRQRADLAQEVFADKINPITMRLLRRAVGAVDAGRLQAQIRALAESAAQIRQRKVVIIHSAHELSSSQFLRLKKSLENIYGAGLTFNTAIDPKLVGGLKIQVGGSEIIDGSVQSALADVRQKLVG